jgi:uncharacterized membrane protein YdjX (TVP38/TMEM64 family)
MKSGTSETTERGRARWFRVIAALVLVLVLVVSLSTSKRVSEELMSLVTRAASEGWYGEAVFLGVLVTICLTGIVPASIMIMAAGTIYGFEKGVLLSSLGLSIGALLGFLASRSLFRDAARRWVSERLSLRRIDADIAEHGWKVVALVRLSPVAPFGITSYALGLTRLRLVDYLLGTIGSLPAMMAYVYIGVLARTAVYGSSGTLIPWVRLAVTGLGVVATVAVAVHTFRILKPEHAEPWRAGH